MITLQTAVRDNLTQALVWSAPVNIDEVVGKGVKFFFRSLGVGKFIRFKLKIVNEPNERAVKDLYVLSLYLMQITESDDVE